MEIKREDWERVVTQSEAMMKDATLSLVNAQMMYNRAKEELLKCPISKDVKKKK